MNYYKGREKELRNNLSSLYVFIETWEPYRAEAKIAQNAGDTEREVEVLKNIFHQLVWQPEDWREATDFVYYEALSKKIRQISASYQEMYTNPTFREKFSDIFNKLF